MRKGLLLARELPTVDISSDFELRLQHRLLDVDSAAQHARRGPGMFATLGVAAAIALLAWSPLMLRENDEAAPFIAQTSAADDAVEALVGPLVVESNWYPVALPDAPAYQAASVVSMFPGPYSPLVVTPPAHRSVRTVSSEYLPVD